MAKQRPPKANQLSTASSPQEQFQAKLKSLLQQKKYRQALDELNKAKRSQPDLTFTPSEAEIWLLSGKQEAQKGDFKQAITSLRQSLELGLTGEPHYWLAKSLLSLNRLEEAIALIRTAFEDGSLPKDYSICYAKLLLLKGDVETVEQLLKKQSKRFPAAQQHWIRGVLALKAQQPDVALASFQKVKQPITPGDRPKIWQIYTQQALQQWDAAAVQLGLNAIANPFGRFMLNPVYTEHPILQRLALLQKLKTGQPSLEEMQFATNSGLSSEQIDVIALLELIEENNPHEAAHVLLKFDRRSNKFPELSALRPALLTLAGQQALTQGEMSCASEFWQLSLREQEFTPQLAVNLMKVLDLNQEYQELQRLITRMIKWLEQDYKQHPQNWTEKRYKETLIYAHCRLADTWMVMGRERTAMGELQTAERIDPRSPEVIGRHGLVAVLDDKLEEATRLLTQALDEGCRYREVYVVLVDTWKKLGNSAAATEIRRRFGKQFGDINAETEVELPLWVDAFLTGNYPFFSRLVEERRGRDPGIRACQLFVDAVQGEPTSGGKVSIDQQQAVNQWSQLLNELSPQEQVVASQAIALCLIMFTKREKGIAALINQYTVKLFELGEQQPEAREAHLVILSLKERDPKKLQTPLQSYLATQPQPGNALAQIQLQLRRYTQSISQDQILHSFLDEALQREPQNPLLLLARATTFPTGSANYEKFHQQGFEIARRVQDAKALQAFREEETVISARMAQEFLPDPDALENFDLGAMDRMLESMIRKMFGGKIPPNELKRVMPQLKQMMMSSMPPDFGEDDEEDFGFPFGGFTPPSSKPPRRRRR
ncbi:tetratricopeptide repeat protein [Oscillatoria sp. FACHB-1407]|uniref:tetratricopeptide repeat protein n=1 Tax=Oscillatoria sp. FACHB-1407 TaxID=2692847 RepID=UPI0016884B0F|nr:tetratricopeptide repeat protein [Oscillatoria sp. FACHB-1407]MBD2459917.1 tetratricopeptide repeat protein [Oscillatoria sp. FACHB-1407]